MNKIIFKGGRRLVLIFLLLFLCFLAISQVRGDRINQRKPDFNQKLQTVNGNCRILINNVTECYKSLDSCEMRLEGCEDNRAIEGLTYQNTLIKNFAGTEPTEKFMGGKE